MAAGLLVLAGLIFFLALFAPVYLHNLQFQNFVSEVVDRRDAAAQSDDAVRSWVVDRAHDLRLPIRADDVKITHTTTGRRIEVRYQVEMDVPGYSVRLHFYPAAGSK
jgi:hypothetical protein